MHSSIRNGLSELSPCTVNCSLDAGERELCFWSSQCIEIDKQKIKRIPLEATSLVPLAKMYNSIFWGTLHHYWYKPVVEPDRSDSRLDSFDTI